ncbi:MAG: type II toxin-antitoxin system HicA family toxin, partial [Trichococcus flocculiformis]
IFLLTFHFKVYSTRDSIPFDTHVLSTYSTIKEEFNKLRTRDLIKLFEQNGWWFLNHGGNHDIYINGNLKEQIVRHKETNEHLAKALIRKYDLK